MSPDRARLLAQRYVAWVVRRRLAIFIGTALVFAAAVYLIAFHLPLKADLANLLPPDAPSVRDLKRLEARVSAQDTALILVRGRDAATREAAATDLIARLRTLPPSVVNRLETDDAETRAYLRAHRHLFVPLADLDRARIDHRAGVVSVNGAARPALERVPVVVGVGARRAVRLVGAAIAHAAARVVALVVGRAGP